MVHGVGDIEEVLPEFAGYILIRRIFARQFEGDRHQVQGVHGHPAGTIGLLDIFASVERLAAIEYADIIQPQKSALENVLALRVLSVHPPCEIQ